MQNSLISKYRIQLMGASVLGVLLVHSKGFYEYPPLFGLLVSYCGIAVYVFAFLSGFGLNHSMRRNVGRLIEFYKRRYVKLLVPYFVIGCIWYIIKDLFFKHSFTCFVLDLSTVSFWLKHEGAWFVAMLIPLYAVYPWYTLLKRRIGIKRVTALTGIIWLILAVIMFYSNNQLYIHLVQVINGTLAFFAGDVIAELEYFHSHKKGSSVRYELCIASILGSILIVTYLLILMSPLQNIGFIFKTSRVLPAVGFIYLFCVLLELINLEIMNKILRLFGFASLEMYLLNIFMIQFFGIMSFDLSNQVIYIIISVFCLCLGVIIGYKKDNLAKRQFRIRLL